MIFLDGKKILKKKFPTKNKVFNEQSFCFKLLIGIFTLKNEQTTIQTLLDKVTILILNGGLNSPKEIRSKKSLFFTVTDKFRFVPEYEIDLDEINRIMLNILQLIRVWFLEFNNRPIETSISTKHGNGDIFIGYQLLNNVKTIPFYLNLDDLTRHVLIVGPSGKGKTTLAKILIHEIIRKKLGNVWVIDFHGEYQSLADRGFIHIKPLSPSNPVSINIFDAKYEEKNTYSSFLTSLLLELIGEKNFEISPQMETALTYSVSKTISQMKSEFRNPMGFIFHLWKWVKSAEKLEALNPTSTFFGIINRVRSFFTGVMQPILWVRETNLDLEDLIHKNVIIDLSGLNKRGASKKNLILFLNIVLRFVMNIIYRRGYASNNKLFLFLEEARYLVPWRIRDSSADTNIIEDFAVLSRKYGLYLISITQSMSSISRDVIENVGTFFLFGADGSVADLQVLNKESILAASLLPPKQAIVVLTADSLLIHARIRDVNADIDLKLKEKGIESQTYKNELNKSYNIRTIKNYKPILIPFDDLIYKIIRDDDYFIDFIRYHANLDKTPLISDDCECKIDKVSLLSLYYNLLNKIDLKDGKVANIDVLLHELRNSPEILLDELEKCFDINNINNEIDKLQACVSCILKSLVNIFTDQDQGTKNYDWDVFDIAFNIAIDALKSKSRHNTSIDKRKKY